MRSAKGEIPEADSIRDNVTKGLGFGHKRGRAINVCNATRLRTLFILVMVVTSDVTPVRPSGFANTGVNAQFQNRGLARAPLIHRVLNVGPTRNLANPSDAAAIVRTGDTVAIDAGTYYDCAVWPRRAGLLTIEAPGGTAVITGRSCEYKALFVIKSDNVIVRGITFTGATAPRHNGAGIRAEGRNLTIEDSQFIDNQEGILAADNSGSTIIVRDSIFKGNGNCIEACAHGIYVGHVAVLRIERSQFFAQYIGHHVKSRAERTELIGNTIEDGRTGTASYLVDIPNGGALVMRNNTLEKGPFSDNPNVAVILGEEGATNVTSEIIIENNEFKNDLPRETLFVGNHTAAAAVLRGNRLSGSVIPLDGPGTVDMELFVPGKAGR